MKYHNKIAVIIILIMSSTTAYCQLWQQYSDQARAFSKQGKVDKAIEYYYKAKYELQRDYEWTTTYADICSNIGVLYFNINQYSKAAPLFIEVRKVREKILGKEHKDYISSCNDLAVIYVQMADYKKAEPLYLEARQLTEKILGKENSDYAFRCNSVGILYETMRLYEKAEPFLKEAKEIRERVLGRDHHDYAISCNNLAIIYKEKGQNNKAEQLFLESKEIIERKSGRDNPEYAAICDGLAGLYLIMGQYKKAEDIFIEAKDIRERVVGKKHPDYGKTCLNLAGLYEKTGQYEKAEILSLEVKDVTEKVIGKENPLYVGTCTSLSILYQKMGKYEKAEMLSIEAKTITERVLGKENPDYASDCSNLAALYYEMGQYKKAELLALEAKQIREGIWGKEHIEYASSCTNLANLYLDMGQYEKAESLFLESINTTGKVLGKAHPDYAGNCSNLAHLYYEMGQYEKALFLCLEAKQITENAFGKEHSQYAESCNNEGNVYKVMGEYQKAGLLYEEAKNLKKKIFGIVHPAYAVSCNNLANLYTAMGQYAKAEPLYYEAKDIVAKTKGKDHPEYASSCNDLANFYKAVEQYEKAVPLYEEAKQIWGKTFGKAHSNYAGVCNNLAVLFWNLKNYNKAQELFMESFAIERKIVKEIFLFTSEKEKELYITKISELGKNAFSFSATDWSPYQQGFAYNISLTNRNLILTSSQQLRSTVSNTTDTNLKNKYNDWIRSREQLSHYYSKPNFQPSSYINNLEEHANTLEKELANLSPDFRKIQIRNETDCQAIRQNLKIDEAAIEFVEFNYYNKGRTTDRVCYVALILTKTNPDPLLVPLFEKKQLDTLLKISENLESDKRINNLYTGDRSLYNLIWLPLEKHLTGISKIYFAPSGNLFKISFAALSIDSMQVLGDKYRLIQLNTTAAVTENASTSLSKTGTIKLFGGIHYEVDPELLKRSIVGYKKEEENIHFLVPTPTTSRGVGFQYLPGSKREIDEIYKQADAANINVTVDSAASATEEAIKSLSGNASPSVLFISTHGFFFPNAKSNKRDNFLRNFETGGKIFMQSDNPLFRSGIVLAGANNAWYGKPVEGVEDGILTAHEVSNMYLPNTKLVVLSACETGLGDIQGYEGVYGLQRAFKMAGVENLVMSLWKVPDTETAEFMQLFFNNIFANQSITDAFYNSQRLMKDKYHDEPYKWAAWVLIR